MIERCKCCAPATGACNDCEAALCDEHTSADFRCSDCTDANELGDAADLFDDPEADDYDPNDEDARYIREQQESAVNEDDAASLNQALRILG